MMRWTAVHALMLLYAGLALAQPKEQPKGDAATTSQAPSQAGEPRPDKASEGEPEEPAEPAGDEALDEAPGEAPLEPAAETPLPSRHRPELSAQLVPDKPIQTGGVVTLKLTADARAGDDVTVPDPELGPLELIDKRARIEPVHDGRQKFHFEIDLLALEPGAHELPPIGLRVVTSEGDLGTVYTRALTVRIRSRLANEPDAELKPATEPVSVIEDDYTLLYVLGGLLGVALVAGLTLLLARLWQRRKRVAPPPPPPRPPWEVAQEKLEALREHKQTMLERGQGALFVDRTSDVVREYLGGRYGFDGLETTTDEMIDYLSARGCPRTLINDIGAYLNRCDLVKFAKVEPNADEVDLVFAKARDLVTFTMPGEEELSETPDGALEPATPDQQGGGS